MSVSTDGLDGAAAGRLELRISVCAGDRETDLLITAARADRVEHLVEAAVDRLDASARLGLWCERRGEQLDAGASLARAGIRWGDRLLLVPHVGEPTRVGGTARIELVVTSGPCAGERFELGDGAYRLGREPGVDILIADPSISRHHMNFEVDASGVRVADAGSSNGTALDGQALYPGSPLLLGENDELELGRTLLRVRPMGGTVAAHGLEERDGFLDFNRPPRVNPPASPFKRELPAPPSAARKGRVPLAASLVPLAAGLLLFFILKSPVMLAIAGMSPLMALSTFIGDRRGGKKSFSRESAEFREKLETAIAELADGLDAETTARRAESPDAVVLFERVGELAPTLWERRPSDPDFLCLRLGVADLRCRSRVKMEDGGDTALRAEAEAKLAAHSTVPSVPLVLNLRETGVVGLSGDPSAVTGLARWLVLQASILHSPSELVVVAALTDLAYREWTWLKWLPHVRPDRVGLEDDAICVGREDAVRLLEDVRDLAHRRRSQTHARSTAGVTPAQVLVLVDEDIGIDRALVSSALSGIADVGIAALWLGRESRDLPGQTGAIVELERERAVLALTEVASGERATEVSADALSFDLADRTARLLAPVRDISELARAGDIPKRVALLDLLDLLPPTAEELKRRWASWQGDLRSTVGVGAGGMLQLDLRSEGPHALIAGTTGSGKSELLRTFVAGAAAAIPPNRLSFLLVDYKGGAAFAPCAALPHVVDIVSDLDEHLAERALTSLNAELKRRERILAAEGAKDLLELTRRNADAAPPLLVIAVDEFAKLREEVPQFVDGVVDIAQRGRSLGVHMVLAAQTLRNAFTPAIRANTNLRLALRVSEESESEDMISSPLAARLPSGESSRGRAFARTGHGELREFQTAYVSGLSDISQHSEMQVEQFHPSALSARSAPAPATSDSDAESDLVLLGEAARQAQQEMDLPIPTPPWLPMLPQVLALDGLSTVAAPDGSVAIGLVDLPHLQRQEPLILDLRESGHVAVFGAGNSGKTTVLTSTALALAGSSRPQDVSVYCLDAASGGLDALQALPHCGGVVMVDDEERVQRLVRLLLRRVETGSRAVVERSRTGEPATTVLLLDDFGSFAHRYDRPGAGTVYEQMQQVVAGGRAAGVHVVLTASRRGALPAALSTHFAQRLVLRMTTEEDMLSLGLDSRMVRGARLPVGSGFTHESREFHIAVPCCEGAPAPLTQAVEAIRHEGPNPVTRIEVLPTEVSRTLLTTGEDLAAIPIGISDEHLGSVAIDLSELHFLTIGPYRSGRSTALATIAHGIQRADPSVALHLLAPRRSPLRELDCWASVAKSSEECVELARSLIERLEAGGFDTTQSVLIIDDGGELTDAMSIASLERLVRIARDSSLRVVASVESGAARGISLSWIRELRREGHGLLLAPDLAADGDLLATRLPRRVAAPMTPGRGFVVARGSAELIHVAA
ncbi:MAG TPA: FtsK/SpoIIIE domain-containing protein [Solirubrobacteraceae bacterium]|nr:FtsK/SpoIIIE domain-containing protein [Solirubrobacteraceae bacterium]